MVKASNLFRHVISSSRELAQIVITLLALILPLLINLSQFIDPTLCNEAGSTFEATICFLLVRGENLIVGLLLAIACLILIRRANKHAILNRGNFYQDKPYCWYFICAKVLGYHKCNLIFVPIYMQFKLILRETFTEYPWDENLFPQKEHLFQVKILNASAGQNSNAVNLIISDTYHIADDQIPEKFRSNYTIRIDRNSSFNGERYYSEELPNTIATTLRKLREGILLHVFATTNPKNNFYIVKKAIASGNRGNIERVYVFQQSRDGDRAFEARPYLVN